MLIFLLVNKCAAKVTSGHHEWLFVVPETKPGASGLLHMKSTTELHSMLLHSVPECRGFKADNHKNFPFFKRMAPYPAVEDIA